jgi:toxin ParE1/3/4
MQVAWTAAALRDLAAIRVYVASDNPRAADQQIALIFAAVARLSDFPELGRIGRRSMTRELVIPRTPYIIPYRIRADTIEVLRVLHGRQGWPDRL